MTFATDWASAFRDYVIEADPTSGKNKPAKSEIRALGVAILALLGGVQFVGTNTPSGDDAAYTSGRAITSQGSSGSHAFRAEDTLNVTAGVSPLYGYAGLDVVSVVSGTHAWNHANGGQARQVFNGSTTIDGLNGWTSNMGVTNGVAGYVAGYHAYDVVVSGGGAVTQQFVLYSEAMTGAVTNLGIVLTGDMVSVFNGRAQSNTRIDAPTMRLTGAGFIARYGQIPTLDTNGEFLPNPVTIINGVMQMSASGGGALGIQASTAAQISGLTAVDGMVTYDSTNAVFKGRQAGAWKTFTLT